MATYKTTFTVKGAVVTDGSNKQIATPSEIQGINVTVTAATFNATSTAAKAAFIAIYKYYVVSQDPPLDLILFPTNIEIT